MYDVFHSEKDHYINNISEPRQFNGSCTSSSHLSRGVRIQILYTCNLCLHITMPVCTTYSLYTSLFCIQDTTTASTPCTSQSTDDSAALLRFPPISPEVHCTVYHRFIIPEYYNLHKIIIIIIIVCIYTSSHALHMYIYTCMYIVLYSRNHHHTNAMFKSEHK